ncbi:MAG TPA: PaaI family thioesterase [Streptosporangiaceae bacterium]|jgi:acyl-coenzyme A thioesterase PaaI-like protein
MPHTAEFVPWDRPSPLLTAIDGFSRHASDPLRAGFAVDGPKLNARGFLHAGVIATVGDVAIGHALATRTDPPTRLLTINLSCDLLGTAHDGEWVDVAITPTRVGRRLASGVAAFSVGSRIVARVTGLFMPAGGPAAAGAPPAS